jgi:hypothetical protein
MAKIDLLRENIEDMSQDRLMGLVRKIREDRKIRKAPEKVKKAAGKKKQQLSKQLQALLDGMEPEERMAFLKQLEEENVDV